MKVHEEEELVERAKQDPEAFGVLFDQCYQHIFGYVYADRLAGGDRKLERIKTATLERKQILQAGKRQNRRSITQRRNCFLKE